MDLIHATTDPKERQKLRQAHMQTMQDKWFRWRAGSGRPPAGMASARQRG
jgi:hypothetical protein